VTVAYRRRDCRGRRSRSRVHAGESDIGTVANEGEVQAEKASRDKKRVALVKPIASSETGGLLSENDQYSIRSSEDDTKTKRDSPQSARPMMMS